MVRSVLLLDTETTSLTPETGQLIEVGIAVWSVDHLSLVASRSWLLLSETNDAQEVNGIPVGILRDHGRDQITTDSWVGSWMDHVDAVVAYGAEFDRKWFGEAVRSKKPWICAMDDLPWPKRTGSKSLAAVALGHGVGMARAHRAIDDVLTMVSLFERVAEMGVDMRAFFAHGLRPKVRFVVADTNYDEKRTALAKAAGFRWEKPNWVRAMPIEDAANLPFTVRQETA